MISHLFKKIIYVFSIFLLFFDIFSEISFKNLRLKDAMNPSLSHQQVNHPLLFAQKNALFKMITGKYQISVAYSSPD